MKPLFGVGLVVLILGALLALAFDEGSQYGFQCHFSFSRASLTALKLYPAFIEAIEHPNAWSRVFHSLRFKQ
jgi:hypothetical protein